MSAWLKKTSSTTVAPGKEILGYGDNVTSGNRFSFWINGNGVANGLGIENGGAAKTFPWTWDNQWHQLTAVLPPGQNDLSAVNLYYDGVNSLSANGSGTLHTVQTELCFGAVPGYHTLDPNYNFDGVIDEVRFSNVARSANWEWAEYQTAAANSQFNNYGAAFHLVSASSVNLSIEENVTNIVISWAMNANLGAALQRSSDLLNWTNISGPVFFDGASNNVTVVPQEPVQFYRLVD
jgi:hypothetical protein